MCGFSTLDGQKTVDVVSESTQQIAYFFICLRYGVELSLMY